MSGTKSKLRKEHPRVDECRERVKTIIHEVPSNDLVSAIQDNPSLRGMILGYISELMFERHILDVNPRIQEINSHDDHDRSKNKSDRDFYYGGQLYRTQLKSIQTNSIQYDPSTATLHATVQNDASDSRTVTLPSGNVIKTVCYVEGDYDLLAVPLFPFTGNWDFAYKWNSQCRATTSSKYLPEDKKHLLATTERITYPLNNDWHQSLDDIINNS